MGSRRVRIDKTTHDQLARLAVELDVTVGATVALAVRALRRDSIGNDLSTPLRYNEAQWLDADLG